MALNFTRDVKLILEDPAATNRWEIPILDGFSFSQTVNSSEITINEAGATSRRARLLFNDALAPVEWSFSTYVRPTVHNTQSRAVEEALWGMFCGAEQYSGGIFTGNSSPAAVNAISGTTSNVFNFNNSNISAFADGWSLYFMFEGSSDQVYKITNTVINSVSADFDIDGIATINWSGFGAALQDNGTTKVAATLSEGVLDTNNFIRNRLTTLTAIRDGEFNTAATIGAGAANQPVEGRRYKITTLGSTATNWADIGADSSPAVGEIFTANAVAATGDGTAQQENQYGLVLTGGNITITNNITFLTPETLGSVNQPIGHVTGSRSVSGSFTCYLNNDTDSSAELFEDLVGATTTVTNNHRLVFAIGGTTPNLPRVEMTMLDCHLELPSHSIDDVISLETAFHALPSQIDKTDELTVKYFGRDPA